MNFKKEIKSMTNPQFKRVEDMVIDMDNRYLYLFVDDPESGVIYFIFRSRCDCTYLSRYKEKLYFLKAVFKEAVNRGI